MSKRRARKGTARRTSRRRRRNPGQPVILVNPTTARGQTLMRRNPRRRRRAKRKNPRRHSRRTTRLARRRNPSGFRRRNPSVSWGASAMAGAIGAAGGLAAYGVNWGVEYIPVSDMWRSVIFGGTGIVTSIALAKYADTRLGAGTMGGFAALLTGRIVTQVRMASVAPKKPAATTPGKTQATGLPAYRMNPHQVGAGAVFSREGGAVFQRDAGAVFAREAGARQTGQQTMRAPVFGPSFKDAGASRFIPGPVRFFGPGSWAYDAGAARGRRYVSAHNR